MVTRVYYEDQESAEAGAAVLFDAGFEQAVILERLAGEDEEIFFVLATPAKEAEVRRLLELAEDAWVEVDEAFADE